MSLSLGPAETAQLAHDNDVTALSQVLQLDTLTLACVLGTLDVRGGGGGGARRFLRYTLRTPPAPFGTTSTVMRLTLSSMSVVEP